MRIPEITEIPDKDLLTLDEVSELLGVRRNALYIWINYGRLRRVKIGSRIIRIERKELVNFIKSGCTSLHRSNKKIASFKLNMALRSRIRKVFTGRSKDKTSMELLGCTRDEFIKHIVSQFQPGMTVENYGLSGWVIDHIIPIAQFNLDDPEHRKICFHYTNLRPMWNIENCSKGKKVTRRSVNTYFTNYHKIT